MNDSYHTLSRFCAVMGMLMLLAAGFFLCLGGLAPARRGALPSGRERVVAVVTAHYQAESVDIPWDKSGKVYCEFAYTVPDSGELRRVRNPVPTDPPVYRIGDQVELLYSAESPDEVMFAEEKPTSGELRLYALMLLVPLGLLLLVLARRLHVRSWAYLDRAGSRASDSRRL